MNFISGKNITLIGEQLFSFLKVNSSPIKKLFDHIKFFSKNLCFVGSATLCSKSEGILLLKLYVIDILGYT